MRKVFSYLGRAALVLVAALVATTIVAPLATAHVVAHAAPDLSTAANWLANVALGLGGGAVAGAKLAMFGPLLHLKGKSYDQLQRDATANASEPEYFPMTWFDSTTYTSAAALNSVPLFATTNNALTVSNMQLAGQFPAGEYFDLGEIHVDVLLRPTMQTTPAAATALPGWADDVTQMLYSSGSTLLFSYRNKPYGPWPLAAFRPYFGLNLAAAGAFAATTAVSYGQIDSVGVQFENTLTIGPVTKFGFQLSIPAVTISQATVSVRVTMRGIHYRAVV